MAKRRMNTATARAKQLVSVIVSGVFTGISLMIQWQNLLAPYGKAAAAVIAIVAGGWLIFKGNPRLRHFSLDMNVLMSVAVIGAAAIGEWTEGAAVVSCSRVGTVGRFQRGRARRAIQSLLELTRTPRW